jgi:hypothetical protein
MEIFENSINELCMKDAQIVLNAMINKNKKLTIKLLGDRLMREIIQDRSNTKMNMCKIVDNEFIAFKSEAHKYIFILLYIDAKNRCDLLGITEQMYYDFNLATEWRNNIYERLIK